MKTFKIDAEEAVYALRRTGGLYSSRFERLSVTSSHLATIFDKYMKKTVSDESLIHGKSFEIKFSSKFTYIFRCIADYIVLENNKIFKNEPMIVFCDKSSRQTPFPENNIHNHDLCCLLSCLLNDIYPPFYKYKNNNNNHALNHTSSENESNYSIIFHIGYINSEHGDPHIESYEMKYDEAVKWMNEFISDLDLYYEDTQKYINLRNNSVKKMGFPFKSLRPGQKELMQKVGECIRKKVPLLAQAPTGTGKTLSTIYPSIKMLGINSQTAINKIFYLTAKNATRKVASDCIKMLMDKGLHLRSITLHSKESSCLCKNMYCDTSICPYATSYYDNLRPALKELYEKGNITPFDLQIIGEKYQICPFELSLDYGMTADIVIGDYAHFFDPRFRLKRFFESSISCAILVDEAHNMSSRSLDMFTGELHQDDINTALSVLRTLDVDWINEYEQLNNYISILADKTLNNENAFSYNEPSINENGVFVAEKFNACLSMLPKLHSILVNVLPKIQSVIEDIKAGPDRRILEKVFFDGKFYSKVQEEYYNKNYISIFECNENPGKGILSIKCLNASSNLSELIGEKHIPIYFSATLEPLEYFKFSIFGMSGNLNPPDEIALPSPFPKENRLVLINDTISTTFNERSLSIPALADQIELATRSKIGNYLVFFPSYSYMKQVYNYYSQSSLSKMDIMVQKSGMTSKERTSYLEKFDTPATEKSLVGFAVLGGSFGEGIDLTGDRLNGVIIVGVGLPGVSPVQNILKDYYQHLLRRGFDFAYTFPGMNKVLQAAGRVIRTETDRGFILLCDKRYNQDRYRNLLPYDWEPKIIHNNAQLINELKNFYQPNKSS